MLSSLEAGKVAQKVGFQASITQQVCGLSDARPPGLLPGPHISSQDQMPACTMRALKT